jgi:hypothetical protein
MLLDTAWAADKFGWACGGRAPPPQTQQEVL